MNIKTIGLFFSFTALITPAHASINSSVQSSIVDAGDMVQLMVPATGFFAAWLNDDFEGAKQLAYSAFSTQLIVHGGKTVIARKRPNETNWKSFPSGHTAIAFSGASFLQTRYGAKWGVPAYLAAAFVGVSRVHGNRHYVGDVVAGAGTAFMINQLIVSPYKTEGVYLSAQPMKNGFALGISVTDKALTASSKPKLSNKKYNHQLELGVGFNFTDSSSQVVSSKYITKDTSIDKYQPFSYINYQYQLGAGDSYEVEFFPSETRRQARVNQDFIFDKVQFNQDEHLLLAFRHWILGNSLYKGMQLAEAIKLDLGLGLYLHMLEVDIDSLSVKDKSRSQTYWKLLPSVTSKFLYRPVKDISIISNIEYQAWGKEKYYSAEAGINYHFNEMWKVGLKYIFSHTKLKNHKFNTQYNSNNLVLTFTNKF